MEIPLSENHLRWLQKPLKVFTVHVPQGLGDFWTSTGQLNNLQERTMGKNLQSVDFYGFFLVDRYPDFMDCHIL